MKILVVEDDKDCMRIIREALGPLVREIISCSTLREAIEIIKANPDLDAVWLDLNLEDANGDKTVASIPELRRMLSGAALIVVSGYETYRHPALCAGADVYATKKELCGFNQQCVAALFVTAAVTAMRRGVNATKILERVTKFFASLSTTQPQAS